MQKNTTLLVHACDRVSCDRQWITSRDGRVKFNRGATWRNRLDPVTCDALKAEFCCPECHAKAHMAEAHGTKGWRRRSFKPRPVVV